jgi:hypothetical protein
VEEVITVPFCQSGEVEIRRIRARFSGNNDGWKSLFGLVHEEENGMLGVGENEVTHVTEQVGDKEQRGQGLRWQCRMAQWWPK